MDADLRRFDSGLRSRCWSVTTSLLLAMSFSPLATDRVETRLCDLWVIPIRVYLRSSAVLVFLCVRSRPFAVFCVLCAFLGSCHSTRWLAWREFFLDSRPAMERVVIDGVTADCPGDMVGSKTSQHQRRDQLIFQGHLEHD
jgi:hypothetical protein